MKITALVSICLLLGTAALAMDQSGDTSATTIKEMQHAPNTVDRSTRTSGRSDDADTGMAAPAKESDAGIRNMNDNMAVHSQAWQRQHDKMHHAQHNYRQSHKSNSSKRVLPSTTSGTTGATSTEGSNSYGAAGTVTGNDRNVTAGDQSKNQRDLEITRQVRQGLMSQKDMSTRAHNLTVVSDNGVVTLRGTVPSSAEKATAEHVARSVSGVASVSNLIQVSK